MTSIDRQSKSSGKEVENYDEYRVIWKGSIHWKDHYLFNNVIAESLDAQFWSNFNAKSIGTSSSDKPWIKRTGQVTGIEP